MPKTGSAYVYTYVTIGEFLAFVIGWNLILEYVIGTSSVARAFSSYFDSLIENRIQNFFKEYMPMNVPGLSEYPDFFAFAITILITGNLFFNPFFSIFFLIINFYRIYFLVILASGVKESSRMNNLFTGVNLIIILFICIFGSIKADFKNWTLQPSDVSFKCCILKKLR